MSKSMKIKGNQRNNILIEEVDRELSVIQDLPGSMELSQTQISNLNTK